MTKKEIIELIGEDLDCKHEWRVREAWFAYYCIYCLAQADLEERAGDTPEYRVKITKISKVETN